MKKVLLLTAVVAMAFTSCSKKDLECTCTSSLSTVVAGTTTTEFGPTTVTKFEGVKKDKAALDCPATSTSTSTFDTFDANFNPTTGTMISTTTCELK